MKFVLFEAADSSKRTLAGAIESVGLPDTECRALGLDGNA